MKKFFSPFLTWRFLSIAAVSVLAMAFVCYLSGFPVWMGCIFVLLMAASNELSSQEEGNFLHSVRAWFAEKRHDNF